MIEETKKDMAEVQERDKGAGWQRKVVVGVDRFALGLGRHWLLWLTLIIAIYVGVPFLAPVFMELDMPGPANAIYSFYDITCHQMAFRSWFLFGEQPYYPRAVAGLPVRSFEEYARDDPHFTGVDVDVLDAYLIYAAGKFIGNEQMGWKVGYCQRDIAIYGSMVLFGVVYGLLRKAGVHVPPLPFWAYILIALVPIGLDGGSQFLSNPPFNGLGLSWYPIRESTPFWRTLTGALFGIGNAWLAYPYLQESMDELAEEVQKKFARAGIQA